MQKKKNNKKLGEFNKKSLNILSYYKIVCGVESKFIFTQNKIFPMPALSKLISYIFVSIKLSYIPLY